MINCDHFWATTYKDHQPSGEICLRCMMTAMSQAQSDAIEKKLWDERHPQSFIKRLMLRFF